MRKVAIVLLVISLAGFNSCKENKKEEKTEAKTTEVMAKESEPFFQLSLAQWSINRMIRQDGLDPYKFAEKASNWGFTGLEYVSQLYYPSLEKEGFSAEAMQEFVDKCNTEAKKYGMTNVLIMVDGQGALAAVDEEERKEAVENHFKWVDAAAAMGCHSIRVNLQGAMDYTAWEIAAVDGLTQLSSYAKDKNINVIVENHGGPSSNAAWLATVMEKVGMPNCGTLPDFGNFCVRRENGSYYESPCVEEYDKYQGVEELMPFAKAVSAKSYGFDGDGNETKIDYPKMMQIVKKAGYSGFVGVEYEGDELSEEAGILATKNLLLRAAE